MAPLCMHCVVHCCIQVHLFALGQCFLLVVFVSLLVSVPMPLAEFGSPYC